MVKREILITLGINGEFTQPEIVLKAGDVQSSAFIISLVDNYTPVNLTGMSAKLTIGKPNGSIAYEIPIITDAASGQLRANISSTTLDVCGVASAELTLYGLEGEKLTLFQFNFTIESVLDTSTGTTSSTFTQLITKVDGMDLRVAALESDNTTNKANIAALQTAVNGKVDDSQVLTNVPANAVFTDTITSVNGKTGVISKADIVALGIPAQDTDTIYEHPPTHPATMIVQDAFNRFTADTEKAAWHSKAEGNHNHDAVYAEKTSTDSHIADNNNPHDVTKAQVGLSNVDNTSDLNKPISTAVATALSTKADTAHLHTGIYEPSFNKNTGFNKNFGSTAGTVAEGNHSHVDLHTHSNKAVLDTVTNTGNGTQFLANDGTYKTISTTASFEVQDNGVVKGVANTVNFATNLDVSVVNGVAIVNSTGAGGGGGDMYKATYDANLNGIADKAESIDDGLGNTATAPQIRTAVTNSHTHTNSTVLNKITYSGVDPSVDLKAIADNTTAISSLQTDKANATHGHIVGDVTGLQAALDSKASTTHTHVIADLTGVQAALDNKADTTHNHDTAYMGINNAYTKTEVDNKGYLANTDMVQLSNGMKVGSKLYYNNIANSNPKYVKLGTVTITGTYNRAYMKMDLFQTGGGNNSATFETFLYHSTAYNTINADTYMVYYNVSGKKSLVDGDLMVVKTDNGSNTYTYEFWMKVAGYGKLYLNVLANQKETCTVDWLPTTIVAQDTAPAGAVNVQAVVLSRKIQQNYFKVATQGQSSFAVGITGFDNTLDVPMIYNNGGLLYEGVHYSISGTTVTLLNNFSLDLNDEILVVINKNTR